MINGAKRRMLFNHVIMHLGLKGPVMPVITGLPRDMTQTSTSALPVNGKKSVTVLFFSGQSCIKLIVPWPFFSELSPVFMKKHLEICLNTA